MTALSSAQEMEYSPRPVSSTVIDNMVVHTSLASAGDCMDCM